MMRQRSLFMRRHRRAVLGMGVTLGLIATGLVAAPAPAHAWWNQGVWVSGPRYWGPPPVVYPPVVVAPPPPVVYAQPPVVYAQPPVIYAPPPIAYTPPIAYPPPAYFPPQPDTPAPPSAAPSTMARSATARSCYAPALTCAMTVPRAPGTSCYCTGAGGARQYGTAR